MDIIAEEKKLALKMGIPSKEVHQLIKDTILRFSGLIDEEAAVNILFAEISKEKENIMAKDTDCDIKEAMIEEHMKDILTIIYGNEWKSDENLKETPKRYGRMMTELTKGLCAPGFKFTGFQKGTYQDVVTMKDIPFFSLCAHHFVPFFGKVSIAYKPHENVVGLSKLPRLVQHLAAKPQIQEGLTEEIVNTLMKELEPDGVMVIIHARHLCMEMRGIKSVGSTTITSSVRGVFMTDMNIRQEVLQILGIGQTVV